MALPTQNLSLDIGLTHFDKEVVILMMRGDNGEISRFSVTRADQPHLHAILEKIPEALEMDEHHSKGLADDQPAMDEIEAEGRCLIRAREAEMMLRMVLSASKSGAISDDLRRRAGLVASRHSSPLRAR
jgi:hypothetical protein